MPDTATPQAPDAASQTPAPAAAPTPAPAPQADPAPAPAPAAATPAPQADPAPTPAPAAPEGAPETYAAFTVPDGAEMDEASLKAFGQFAKDLNLSQAAAQAMIDKLAPVAAQRQAEQIAAMRAEWKNALAADPDLGKPENQGAVKAAIDKFGSPELTQLLETSGLIDHPAIARTFLNVSRAVSNDKVITGRQPGTSPNATVAQRMYPNMNP